MTQQKPSLLILVLLISFGSVGAVAFSPGMPGISQFFHISVETTQLTVYLGLLASGWLWYRLLI